MKAFFANRWLRGIIALFLLAAVFFGYQWWSEREGATQTTAALVLAEVATGPVTSGIRTTGTIEAAEVLDLNVYKLDARIEELAVVNGAHVGVGDLILAFDESDAAVAIAESQLSIREAQLALDTTREEVRDPSTLIASLRNDIVVLERALVEHKKDADEALRDFLNADLTAEPSARRYEDQVTRTAPGIGGLFSGDSRGTYKIYVYASGAESGYSYRLEGLESGTFDVFPNASTPLGTR
nr:efflux RND transporter periplasmic adaptor subunit [Candidatus Paceibacterota bacterium]